MRRIAPPILLPLALALAACATTSGAPTGSRNVITEAELTQAVDARTAFDAIQKLRPAFLRRGRVNQQDDTMSFPIVYLDGMRLGGVDELRRIRTFDLTRIEYLSASDATLRYGTGHTGGALLLTSRVGSGR